MKNAKRLAISSAHDGMGLKFTLEKNSITLDYDAVLGLKRAINVLFQDQYGADGDPYADMVFWGK